MALFHHITYNLVPYPQPKRSEDGTVKLWHSTTYRLETTLDYRMERVWGLGYLKVRAIS